MKTSYQGAVSLPGSKSESNRALMIAAYGGFSPAFKGLSNAHDTVLLQSLLQKIEATKGDDVIPLDAEDAGTAVRFLLPLLSGREGTWLLTGSGRMRQRPIGPLVDALRQIGAEITCLDQEGCLPVRISGKTLVGGTVTLDASQSSQFVSALLLAAPMWEQGLEIQLIGGVASLPYVAMTISMMVRFGAQVYCTERSIKVLPYRYQPYPFKVAADWSAASYWYELAALSDESTILLKGLQQHTLQGDAVLASWYERFGVHTVFDRQGARLSKMASSVEEAGPLVFDFNDTPDLFPSVVVTSVALHRHAIFTGVKNLALKESDRVKSLITELNKLYTFINIIEDHKIELFESSLIDINHYNSVVLETYSDHRVAMALAPLTLLFPFLTLDHPEVVGKSYPDYWREFESLTKS